MRAVVVSLLCVVAAAGGSGCGADTVDPATIVKAADATSGAGGARLSLEGEGTVQGRTIDISGTGEFDEKGRSAMEMELPGGAGIMRQVFADYVMYQQIPGAEAQFGKEWVKTDLRRAYAQVGVKFDSLLPPGGNDPRQMVAQLENAAGEIEKVGSDEVRGAETTHYKGDVDLRKSVERLPAGQRAEAKRSVEKVIELSGTESYPFEVWIDEKDLVRRMRMQMTMNNPALGGKLEFDFTMELFDYGAPIQIEVPDDDDAADITDQVAAQLKSSASRFGAP